MEKQPRPKLTIVIPTYNEGGIIEASLRKLADVLGGMRAQTEVIIADDGRDDLPGIVERCGQSFGFRKLRIMRNEVRAGKGESIRRAFGEAEGEIIGFMDADHYVDPSFIHDALRDIDGGKDIAIASRSGDRFKSDPSFLTSVLGSLFAFINRNVLFEDGRSVSDTQCGFKFFRREAALDLYRGLVARDGLTDLEVLIKASRQGYRVSEISVPRRRDRDLGKRRLSSIFVKETISLGRLIMRYNPYFVAAVGILILAALFSTYKLTESPSFWYDEGWYFQSASNLAMTGEYALQFAPGELSPVTVIQTVSYPLLFPLALWLKAFGTSVLAGRSFMALVILAFLIAAYALSRRLFNDRVAVGSIALLATFAPLYGNGKSILGELPGMLYVLLFLLCLGLTAKQARGRYRWALLVAAGLCAGLALSTKPFFLILGLALVVGAAIAWKRGAFSAKELGAMALAALIPLVSWYFIQVNPEGASLSTIWGYYSNPYSYDSAALRPGVLEAATNALAGLGKSLSTLYTLGILLIWTAAVAWRLKARERLSIEEIVSFIFALTVFVFYLRVGGIFRYFFPAQLLALIFLPNALMVLVRALPRAKVLPAILIALLALFGAYQVMFDSWVAEAYRSRKTRDASAYLAAIPEDKTLFFYDTPELAALVPGREYYQLLLSMKKNPLGKAVLPAIESGQADLVFIESAKFEPLQASLFKRYAERERLFKYSVLERKK